MMLKHFVLLIGLTWLLQALLVQGLQLGETCNEEVNCQSAVDNSDCDINSTCVCQTGYYDTNGVDVTGGACAIKLDLGEPCNQTDSCIDSNTECMGSVCSCQTGYYDTDGSDVLGGMCSAKVGLGSDCPQADACDDANAFCSDGICVCNSTYYDSDGSGTGGTCVAKVGLGSPCPQADACDDTNAYCSGVCVCDSFYYDNNGSGTAGGTCVAMPYLGENCFQPDACYGTYVICDNSTDTCICAPGYYNIDDVDCAPEVLYLGENCFHPDDCLVVDPFAICDNSTDTCICAPGYYNVVDVYCEPEVLYLGENCFHPDACHDMFAICDNSTDTCICAPGYYNADDVFVYCEPEVTSTPTTPVPTTTPPATLGAPCSETDQCVTLDAVCNGGICMCGSSFYDDNGTCEQKVELGSTCPQADACEDANAECTDSTCICKSTHYDSDGGGTPGGTCEIKVELGSTCPQADACEDANSECSGSSTCICKSTHYDSDGSGTLGGTCVIKVGLGSNCPQADACVTANAECSDNTGTGTCFCKSTHYDSDGGGTFGGTCVIKVGLETICPQADACEDANAECTSSTGGGLCICKSTHYDNDSGRTGGTCVIKSQLGSPCTLDYPNTCSGDNVVCDSKLLCECATGFYEDQLGNKPICLAKIDIGGDCNRTDQCSANNSLCTGDLCECMYGYNVNAFNNSCVLVDCGVILPSLPNGEYILKTSSNTTYGALANATCNTGFESELLQIECLATGEWSNDAMCTPKDCGVILPSLSNGEYILKTSSNTTYGALANVTCNTGFESEVLQIECLATGEWSNDAMCTPKDCGSVLPILLNGGYIFLKSEKFTYGAVAYVLCFTGFESEVFQIECLATGEWANDAMCTPKDCGSVLPNLLNGGYILLDSSNTTYGALANATCNTGFESEVLQIECIETGEWSTDAMCTPKDCGTILPKLNNGEYTLVDPTNTTYRAIANTTCDPGYDTLFDKITCQASGKWDNTTCVIKDCGDLPDLANGQFTLLNTSNSAFGALAKIECNTGFESEGVSIQCLVSGQWSANDTKCTPKECGDLPITPDGQLVLVDQNNASYGAMANVSCAVGYTANTSTIICLATGTWGGSECIINDCGVTLPGIANGKYTLTNADITTYLASADVICNEGYSSTTDVIVCQASGQWNESTCVIKECGELPTIPNGEHVLVDMNNASYGAMAYITCDTGYTANTPAIVCLATGIWQGSGCTIQDCGAQLPDIANGKYTLTNADITTYLASADVICNEGYSSTTDVIVCQASGQWNDSTCVIKECGELPTIPNGEHVLVDMNNASYGAKANVTCDTGYTANTPTIVCLSTGIWQDSECTRQDCGAQLPDIANGQYTLTNADITTYLASADVICNEGYSSTTDVIVCQATGQWNESTCVIKECGELPTIPNGEHVLVDMNNASYGAIANLTCDTGYTTNTSTIVCLSTGIWQGSECTIQDCGAQLPDIANGQYTLTNADITTYLASADVICNEGYSSTTDVIVCQASGQWNESTCVIKECGELPTIPNGEHVLVDMNNASYGAKANLTCDTGYTANMSTIVCLSTGIWQGSECTIQDCGATLPDIANGKYTLTNADITTYLASADVICNEGYSSTADAISCQATGQWNESKCVIKECGELPTIPNGEHVLVDMNNASYGAIADLTCDMGYTANTSTIVCLATGIWQVSECTIQDCGAMLPDIANGNYALTNADITTYLASADVICNEGYSSTTDVIVCQASGQWNESTCVIMECGELPTIANGEHVLVDMNNASYGAIANVTCDMGYTANTSTIVCLSTAIWQGSECTIQDCGAQLPDIENGNYALTNADITTYLASADVICNEGYSSTTDVIVCQASGQWNESTCVIKECGELPTIPNGEHVLVDMNNASYGAKANLTCDTGYTANTSTIVCLSTGIWQGSECTIQDCGTTLPDIANGKYTLTNADSTTYLASADVICNEGYSSTADVIVCQASGQWNDSTCVIKDCGDLPSIDNGSYELIDSDNTSYGALANVECSPGFNASISTIGCLSTGAWTEAVCIVKACPDPVSPSNGVVQTPAGTTYTSKGIVSCDPGYELIGEAIIVCQANGTWSESPTCLEKDCQDPQIASSVLNDTATTYDTVLQVTCDAGYAIQGPSVITCQTNATWSTKPTCDAKDCGTLNDPTNGNIDVSQGTTFGDQAAYTCNAGFDLVGDKTRDCVVNDGTLDVAWSGTAPVCERKDCGAIEPPDNGGINANADTHFGSTITYACKDGYVLVGDSTRDCLATGQWSGLQPTCIKKDVPITTCANNIDSRGNVWNVALVGQTRIQTCAEGFSGNVTRFCKTNGQWELPKYNCIREAVKDVQEQVSNLNTTSTEAVKNVIDIISNLTVPQGQTSDEADRLTDAELDSISKSLDTVAKALVESDSLNVDEVADIFVESASNLLDSSNTERWKALKESDTGSGAEKVLSAVDSIGEALRKQLETNATNADKTIVKENIAIEVKKVQDNVLFPGQNSIASGNEDANWIKESKSSIELPLPTLDNDASYVTTTVMYRNMSDILPTSTEANATSDEEGGEQINAPIIALTISPPITTKLDPPVKITFTHYLSGYDDPECRFWKAGSGGGSGYWNDEGCMVNTVESDVNKTVCECEHLTNFAVLMSPFKVDAESQAIRIISIVGISISIVCLLVTVVLHMCLWKNVRSDRATLLMNLCVALCLAYVVFLAGVDRTESKTFCTIIAAVLQYLYLAVFCLMLGEGIELVFTVLVVFATRSRLRKILIMAWVTPGIIVAISLGVTRGDGYGNDKFCWLSIEDGLIWSFVGPALAIILFNLICLIVLFRSMFKMKAMETKTVKEKVSTGLRSLVVLVPLMGVSWIFGIFYVNDDLEFMQYIFAVLNGLQGVFIFVMHCIFNKQIRNALKLRERRRSTLKETFRSTSKSTSKGDRKGHYAYDASNSLSDPGNSGFGNSGYSGNWRERVLDNRLDDNSKGTFDAPLGGSRRGSGILGAHPMVAFNTNLAETWKQGPHSEQGQQYSRTGGGEKYYDNYSSGYARSERI